MQTFQSDWIITDGDDNDLQLTIILSIELESVDKPICIKERKAMKDFNSPCGCEMSDISLIVFMM